MSGCWPLLYGEATCGLESLRLDGWGKWGKTSVETCRLRVVEYA